MKHEKTNEKMAQRKARVQKRCAQFEAEGYRQIDLTISAKTANSRAVASTLPLIVLHVLLFGWIAGWRAFADLDMGLLGTAVLVSIVVHELIHGLFFALAAPGGFRSVEFGVFWESMNPYCYCAEPVSKGQYLTALTMPGILLGTVVGVMAICFGSATWLLFSLVAYLLASGDFFIAVMILRYDGKGKQTLFLDHPDQPGLLVFQKEH